MYCTFTITIHAAAHIQKLLAKLFGILRLRTQVTIASMRKSCNHSCKINNKANQTEITNVIEIQN